MKIPTSQTSRRFGANMTPLIDVVFLLIIFFLVSSQLARQEANIELELPEASTGSAPPEVESRRITITVRGDGSMSIGGVDIPIDKISSRLQDAVNLKGEDVEVRIRASRDLPYSEAEKLMLACARQGIWNVTYAVYQRKETLP